MTYGISKLSGPIYRIEGGGNIGGKARGLVFASDICNRHIRQDPIFEGLTRGGMIRIRFPKCFVMTTGFFNEFVRKTGLERRALECKNDADVMRAFLERKGELDEAFVMALSDVSEFFARNGIPMSARSSGKEDLFDHSFSGVYKTVFVRNNGSKEQNLNDLKDAVLIVWASNFCMNARAYRSKAGIIDKEGMAVILTEAIGRDYGGLFYPFFSGVALSRNGYPEKGIPRENGRICRNDGVCRLAIGLGPGAVENESVFMFAPAKPKVSYHGEGWTESQKYFYAIDLLGRFPEFRDSETGLVRLPIQHFLDYETALERETGTMSKRLLHALTSAKWNQDTGQMEEMCGLPYQPVGYSMQYNFKSLLSTLDSAVPQLIHYLSGWLDRSFLCGSDTEFAGELNPDGNMDLVVLQTRPHSVSEARIVLPEVNAGNVLLEIREHDDELKIRGRSNVTKLTDVLFVKNSVGSDDFSASSSFIARAIGRFNEQFANSGRRYALVVPGRIGSKESSLGIPCELSDIGRSSVIIEIGGGEFSEGAHFATDLEQLGIVSALLGDAEAAKKLLDRGTIVDENKHFIHLRYDGVSYACNGKKLMVFDD
ncbi:MAG: PEP/pyruvate-binding domain-containing protein [Candidatus ainarchaeum sp.]|nr:PEP/pyruvate-binding domain-containing protein [Candidatus ainarchaeum sp.]